MAGLTLKGIYKKYPGGVVAVSDVNLEIRDKEFIVLVGPSGCGKTTLLRVISGLIPSTSGDVFVDGLAILINANLNPPSVLARFVFLSHGYTPFVLSLTVYGKRP